MVYLTKGQRKYKSLFIYFLYKFDINTFYSLEALGVMYGMYRWPLCMIVQIKPCGFVDPTWRSCCAYVTWCQYSGISSATD